MKNQLLMLLAVAAIGLAVGCDNARNRPPPPPTVSVAKPIEKDIVEWDEYIGRLEAPETVEIRARVSGYLDKVHFKRARRLRKVICSSRSISGRIGGI